MAEFLLLSSRPTISKCQNSVSPPRSLGCPSPYLRNLSQDRSAALADIHLLAYQYISDLCNTKKNNNTTTNFISQIRDNTIIGDRVDMMAGCQEGRSHLCWPPITVYKVLSYNTNKENERKKENEKTQHNSNISLEPRI